jgi:hypothetical protein
MKLSIDFFKKICYNYYRKWEIPFLKNTNGKRLILMSKKMTKREMFVMIRAQLTDQAQIDFIDHELELLAKKNSGERKLTSTQKENLVLKSEILDNMESGRKYTITDMMKEFEALKGLSNQKVSRLVTQLKEDNLVERVEEKRKVYFVKIEV